MDVNRQKEEFGMAYVQAIASVAGYSVSRPSVDDQSIDIQFKSNSNNNYRSFPSFEAQLKCTAQDLMQEDAIHLSLKLKNYNDLRSPNVLIPRILVCVILPSHDPSSWLAHSEEELSLMKCAYWVSLRDFPSTVNSHTVTIQIPKSQIFNVSSLKELMENVGKGSIQV